MCGIIGVVGAQDAHDVAAVRRGLDALGHRGPDGRGVFEAQHAVMGHTRLAIIDPTATSDQPMIDAPSGCVLVFNGEIYNYVELRGELEGEGHRFVSTGDTEVLLHAYLAWGDACVDHLNGMFAFAIWDPHNNAVLLARDRLGEKPLHLAEFAGRLWFASEVKALIAAGLPTPKVDADHLFSFLAYGDLGHPTRTPFVGVEQLPAGHRLWIRPGEGLRSLRPRRYWTPGMPGRRADADGFAELFSDSVRLRLRSDVPLGTSLSGGLDSSLVLASVRAHHPAGELHAFTASFPGTTMDELPQASAVADRLGVTIHPVPLGPADLVRDLDTMITANEGPVESPSTLAQYCVMRAAREARITVLLDGQGADETWAGYDKYAGLALLDDILSGHLGRAVGGESSWQAVHGGALRPSLDRFAALIGGGLGRRSLAPAALRLQAGWLHPAFRRAHRHLDPLDGARAIPPGRMASAAGHMDLTRVTLPRLLRYADRNSMAWSREVRLPFLDHRLVEMAVRCSFETKVVDGWTKEPVRRALSALCLDEVARRRDKKTYMPPIAEWLDAREMAERVRGAWADLHHASVLASRTPTEAVLPRWRVLAVSAWLEAFHLTIT